ncbi:MAG: LacI family DNA-binding transcriptional regulator [Capsulimonadaceae bacterium]|nr:LacI family DNA-binding transcriptional regulator [Capsulimonadaceae bacterium]
MAVTQAEIAKVVGVSQTIVSDVIHGRVRGRVRPETRQRILAAARQMGYRPNALAQALRLRQSRQIVYLSVHDESREFPILREADLAGVAKALRIDGYRLLIEIANDAEREVTVLTEMIGSGICDGGILRAYRGSDQLWEELSEIREPVVVIGQCPHPTLTSVAHDVPAFMTQAVEHLKGLGHDRIGLVIDPVYDVYHRLLLETWRKATGEGDPARWQVERTGRNEVMRVVKDWLAEPDGPTAIVSVNDACTLGTAAALRSAGRTLGRDFDLHGISGGDYNGIHEPGTWISALDMDAVGSRAARELLAMLDGKPGPGPVRLPAPLVQITYDTLST